MAANLLWAHLLRKDATTSDMPSQIPPTAPQDKTGTSMRMLIHDTQTNLEKFSARLDSLLQRVDDCRAQVVNANKLLDVERDKVLAEILEIGTLRSGHVRRPLWCSRVYVANRCQSEMKAYVGVPAQATALDLVHVSQVSTEKSVQALERRIDALQAVRTPVPTHGATTYRVLTVSAQLFQTHVHVMQSMQDQQNTLIGTILPLVPIIHGVPPQIDQIKASLSDMVANAVSTMAGSVESVRSTLIAEFARGHGPGGSSTRAGSSSKSMASLRRRRSNVPALGRQEMNVPLSSPLDSRSHGGLHYSLKRARIEGMMHGVDNVQLPRKLSRLGDPLVDSRDPRPLLQTPKTPRRPLADLPLPRGSNTSRVQHCMEGTNSRTREYMRPPETLATIPTPISRPLFQSLGHVRPDLQGPTITGRCFASNQDALSKAIKIEEILEPKLTGVFSIRSSPLSSAPSSPRLVTQDLSGSAAQQDLRLGENAAYSQVELVEVPPLLCDPITSNGEASPPKSMSLRDRRAQMSKVRRKKKKFSRCTLPFLYDPTRFLVLVWAHGSSTLHPVGALVG